MSFLRRSDATLPAQLTESGDDSDLGPYSPALAARASRRPGSKRIVLPQSIRAFRLVLTPVLCLLFVFAPLVANTREVALPFPPTSPESVGLSSIALEQLADKVRGYLEQGQLVGAELLVIKDRRTVLHEVFGWRDVEHEIAMTPGTIFNIRSMTKPLTGAAVQILIDEGKLRLDDRAATYIPGFATEEARDITIRQLLTHRSGLPVSILAGTHQYQDLLSMANAVGKRGPQFPVDSKFWYSDSGTDVLGAIVEVVSGMPLHVFSTKRLFEPLGMTDSFVPLDKNDPRWSRLATTYIGRAGHWSPFWSPDKDPLYPFAWGSQTVYSTPIDYARFLALWMDQGVAGDSVVLSSTAVERTLSPVSRAKGMFTDQPMPTGFPDLVPHYGQMAVVWTDRDGTTPRVIGHSGSDGTFAWAWPEENLMVLYFTQSRGGLSGLSLERWIDELLIHPDRKRSIEISEGLLQEIVGEYLADFGTLRNTTVRVFLSNDRPVIDLGRGGVIELLDPNAEGRWYFAISNRTAVSFTRNAPGSIDALRMHEGAWSFEAPRKGVAIEPTVDEASLRKYLGAYRVESMDANIEVVIHNHRLSLDKSALPAKLPTNIFELDPPKENDAEGDGHWSYRINGKMSAAFDEDEQGNISALRIFEGGELEAIATRVQTEPEP